MGDKELALLEGLTELRTLDLSDTKITDDGSKHIDGLKNLKTLALHGTAISVGDEGLKHLHNLTQLRSVDLFRSRVTAAGERRLQTVLPETRVTR